MILLMEYSLPLTLVLVILGLVLFLLILMYIKLKQHFEHRTAHLQELSQQLENAYQRDYLTGLPNRAYLTSHFEQIVAKYERTSFIYINIDYFKSINDAFGHYIGDRVLLEVVHRIHSSLLENMSLIHLGGDEFLVVANTSDDINQITTNILNKIQDKYYVDDKVKISASIGIANYPTHGKHLEELLMNADFAMHVAKEQGRNCVYVYDPAEKNTDEVKEKSQRLNEIKKAIDEKQFILYYQPKFTPEGVVCGAEALIRWNHPTKGILGPNYFIDIIENSNLIIDLGYWVLEEACQQIQKWEMRNVQYFPVSVNLSALQFEHPELLSRIKALMVKYQIQPEHLMIEVTETTAMRRIERAMQNFKALRRIGVLIAIDDFGTGYSNFSYLKNLPVDELKIDRSFIIDIEDDDRTKLLLKAIIDLTTTLGLQVTVEGVETKEQVQFLKTLRCPQIQGFYFSKPLPVEQLPLN